MTPNPVPWVPFLCGHNVGKLQFWSEHGWIKRWWCQVHRSGFSKVWEAHHGGAVWFSVGHRWTTFKLILMQFNVHQKHQTCDFVDISQASQNWSEDRESMYGVILNKNRACSLQRWQNLFWIPRTAVGNHWPSRTDWSFYEDPGLERQGRPSWQTHLGVAQLLYCCVVWADPGQTLTVPLTHFPGSHLPL